MGQETLGFKQTAMPCMEHAHDADPGKKSMTIGECGNFDSVLAQADHAWKSPLFSSDKMMWPLAAVLSVSTLLTSSAQQVHGPPTQTDNPSRRYDILLMNARLLI